MILNTLDWTIVIVFFIFSLLIGLVAMRKAGKSYADFFLSGRNMPWWLLGVSMVATTFSCDTPNLVADIVRQNGVAGNWAWWAFLLTGMLTVFIYAKLWRRSGVLTDLEFYEIRYGGKPAAFLRGFRALYLGVFFNVLVIATVCLALIKIGAVMLNWSAVDTLLVASVILLIYSVLGGLRGILLTDFFQFIVSMIGAIGAAFVLLKRPEIGGLTDMLTHPNVMGKLNMLPDFSDSNALWMLFILPLAVQWWSVWYPGSEPGGGGYIAQRMLSAKDEKGAIKSTLFFNIAHYALRPWPWILVALASLIIFPDLVSLQKAFPNIDPNIVQHDLAYPAMMSLLPHGFLGLVVASLIAAFMSTVSTQLNWGASYIVHDFYFRFFDKQASDKKLVLVGRIATVSLMVLAGLFALVLQNALGAFNILLQVGAGTGLIFILRWFWWRINAWSELTAMIVSFLVALFFQIIYPYTGFPELTDGIKLVSGVGFTTIAWVLVTFITRPTDKKTLINFNSKIQAGGPGWEKVNEMAKADGVEIIEKAKGWDVPTGILCMVLGTIMVYSALFCFGYFLFGNLLLASILFAIVVVSGWLLNKTRKRLVIL